MQCIKDNRSIKNGDIVEIEISEVGRLVNPVLDENSIL